MIKSYDRQKNYFLPFANLTKNKRIEIASLMRTAIDDLIVELKNGKDNIDLMDVLMFKTGVKKKMLQVRLNELFSSSYRFMSEGFGWNSPQGMIDEDQDVVRIEVYPKYLPIGKGHREKRLLSPFFQKNFPNFRNFLIFPIFSPFPCHILSWSFASMRKAL